MHDSRNGPLNQSPSLSLASFPRTPTENSRDAKSNTISGLGIVEYSPDDCRQ